MQFVTHNTCTPVSPTSPWLPIFRHINPSFDSVFYSEEIGLTYSFKDAFTPLEIQQFVKLAPVLRCRVYLTKTRVVEGLFLDLYKEHGRNIFPVRMEGPFVLFWERTYKETPLADVLHVSPKESHERLQVIPKYVFGEIRGQKVEDVVFFQGKYSGEPGITIGDQLYVFSTEKLTDTVVNMPYAVGHAFFSRRPTFVAPLHREESYISGATSYSTHYHERHLGQLEKILEWFPESGYIEPGCGAGIVVRLKSDVVAGDPHPPEHAHPLVRQETFAETIGRGQSGMIVVCAYIHTFLTEADISLLDGRQVIWVDSPDRQCPGRMVFPGVWVSGINNTPQSFLLEKPVTGYLTYTENLLNNSSFALLRESEYSSYLRIMRPNMTLVHLPGYVGGYTSPCRDDDAPVLCTTIRDILYVQREFPQRQIYFSEIGRMFTGFLGEVDIMSEVGYCKIYYQTRTAYRIPKESLFAAIIDYTPHVTIGDNYYFYDRCDPKTVRRFKYVARDRFVKGEILIVEQLHRQSLSVEVTDGGRVYLRNQHVSFTYLFDGTVEGYKRFFYSFFCVGMTRQQFGAVSRGLARLVLADHRSEIQMVRQQLEMSDLSSASISRICGASGGT